jgi:hypothetical protein
VQGNQVLDYRQGLLAEAKDIGKPAATASKGEPLMVWRSRFQVDSCTIILHFFLLDRG